jgi:hypothetical protein
MDAIADYSWSERTYCYDVEEKINGIVKTYADMQPSLIASPTLSEFQPSDDLDTS